MRAPRQYYDFGYFSALTSRQIDNLADFLILGEMRLVDDMRRMAADG